MPAIVVPDLKRKFALLRAYSTRRTWPELAEAFGKPFKTLQFWQDGTDVRDKNRMPDWALKLGDRFRIAIRRSIPSGYPVAVQHAQRAWTLLPVALSQPEPATILVPGIHDGGEPRFMYERRDPGRHLFVCLETAAPPPASLMALLRDEITIDKRALDTLVTFYTAQPRPKRACHLLALEFEAAEQP